MLVLSRRSNESIILGHHIEIVVLGVEGDNVKLGIRAPKEVDIYRKEIYDTIQAENLAASKKTISLDDVSKLFKK
ncbi:carbon storage regulator CsrA [Paenibacillus arenilitoris]|uniref:Translational regulator CsrA n=1 Tax=Paenibacillus arenilitoris TaxID=2772299 RepID=A0A927H6C2_9BACL|nr:carbon storage regulator CsrA [Paenibacillus arenilitoris]MBD2868414.1 carbon storage regulator CsrA [Paenibacillus arenilitoris]